jgi:hypothetical protein
VLSSRSVSANYVSDPLRCIVDHHSQLIRDDPVSPRDDEIANIRTKLRCA